MKVFNSKLPGVKLLEPKIFSDARGFFLETYNKQRYLELGIDTSFVQDNHSHSKRHVLRGLHYQLNFPQGKLVSVVQGEVLDVVVDIRLGSPTFKQWESFVLSAENRRQVYVPPGYAHGFVVLSEQVDFVYKCTDYYHPEDEKGLVWNDASLEIDWKTDHPLLSEKDQRNKSLFQLQRDQELPVYQGH